MSIKLTEKSHIDKVRNKAINELKEEIGSDISISNIVDYLKKHSKIGMPGRMGTDCRVNKEALRLAAVYLEDYLYTNGEI